MTHTSTRAERLRSLLERAYSPAQVSVDDQSARHAGHAGASQAGETHYGVRVVSPVFAGMGRVARSRSVHETLAAEFAAGMHALTLQLQTPDEAQDVM